MVDTHCHLNFKAFDKDLPNVVRRFQKKGGEYLVVVGAKIDSSLKALEIAKKYPICFASVGIHPHHVDSITSVEKAQSDLLKLTSEKKVVAIGETGLDYYQYKGFPPITPQQKLAQKKLFLLHLKLTKKLKLPLIIHCRSAQSDLLEIISKFMREYRLSGVWHCFEGSKVDLERLLSLGFFVGFDGNITYKENKELRMLVKETPLDKLLLETDSPFLSPNPYRGLRNEPSYIDAIARTIANIKKKTTEEILRRTTQNAYLLFNLC